MYRGMYRQFFSAQKKGAPTKRTIKP